MGRDMECILGQLGLWETYGEIWGESGKEKFPGKPVLVKHPTHSSNKTALRGTWSPEELKVRV